MAKAPTKIQTLPTKRRLIHQRLHQNYATEESDRKIKIHLVSRKTILGPKERNNRKTSNIRPIRTKQVHSLPSIQNDNSTTGQGDSPTEGMGVFDRLKGRLLAPANTQEISSVPRLQNRKQKISVQSPTIWTKHRPLSVHKNHKSATKTAKAVRYKRHGLPGRLASLGQDKTTVYQSYISGHGSTAACGIHHKFREIQAQPIPIIPVAGNQLEHKTRNSRTNQNILKGPVPSNKVIPSQAKLHPKNIRESARKTTVCFTGEP